MKVSVITVCRNEVKTIKRTIDSVLTQAYPTVEYIIIDGFSTDGTRAILSQYERYVSILISENDDGIYDAMNKGFSLSSGDVVYYLNGNDYFFSDLVVQSAVDTLKSSPETDILSGAVEYVNFPTVDRAKFRREDFNFENKMGLYKRPIPQQCIFSRRRVFDRVGVFDTRYSICADYDWLVRAITKGSTIQFVEDKFAFVDCTGISYVAQQRRISEKRRIILRQSTLAELFLFVIRGLKQRLNERING